jgi:hypothetical protein
MSLAKVLRIQAAFERRSGIQVTNRKIASGGTVSGVKINLRLNGSKDISSIETAAKTADSRVVRFADKDEKDDSSSGEVSADHAVAIVQTLGNRSEMLGIVSDADQSEAKTDDAKTDDAKTDDATE